MYCPSCGTQNIENAQFCRGCGENISLVPQALKGQMPENRAVGYDAEGQPYDASGRRIRRDETPRPEKAMANGFIGLAFLIIAIILAFKGQDWWFWLLIPAFGLMGSARAQSVYYNQAKKDKEGAEHTPKKAKVSAVSPPPRASALPPRDTSELVQPPSVTEGTTRHLNIKTEVPRQQVNNRKGNQGKET